MSLQDSYNLLNLMSKRFKDRVRHASNTTSSQRTASIGANNIQSTDHAMKVNELVKDIQRVGSSAKVDEVGLLKSFLSRPYQ